METSTVRGHLPWRDSVNSVAPKSVEPYDSPEQIERCLSCGYATCINCAAAGNPRRGRPDSFDDSRLREMLDRGLSLKQIAAALSVSPCTVKYRKRRLHQKFL